MNSGEHVLPLDSLACTLQEKNQSAFQHISQIYLKGISISIWFWVGFTLGGDWGFGGFFLVTINSYFH